MRNNHIFARRCRLYRRRLITLLLIAVMFGIAVAWRRQDPACSMALVLGELALLLIAGWVLFVSYRLFKRNGIRISVFIVLFLWGAWLFTVINRTGSSAQGHEFLDAANNSLAAFFPSRGPYEEAGLAEAGPGLQFQYHLFHFVIYLYFGAIVFSFFGRRLVNWGRRWLVPCRDLNVFWGLSPQGLLLAKDIYRNSTDEQNLFLLPRELRGDREQCLRETDRLDSENFLCDFADFENVRRFFCGARRHLFLSDNPHWNVEMVQKLVDHLRAHPGCGKKPSVYVRIDKGTDESFLYSWAWAEQVKELIDVHIFSETALTARNFARRYPMLDCPGISINTENAAITGGFRLLLLGFGRQGEELLKNEVCDSQFNGTTFQADIIDRDPKNFETYACQCPEAVREYHLNFYPMDVDGGEFHQWFSSNAEKYNRILVCLGQDEFNLKTTEVLLRIFKDRALPLSDHVIFTRIGCQETYEYCRNSVCRFVLFGRLSDIYRKDVLIDEVTDLIAKNLNQKWTANAPDRETAWRNASFFSQESSRSSAAGQRNLLRLIGYDIGKTGEAGSSSEEVSAGIEQNIIALSINEHLRWNAFHFTRGVHFWDMKNPPLDSMSRKKANQVEQYNRHAALVPFENLPDVDYAVACAEDPENAAKFSRDDFTPVLNPKARPTVNSLQGYDMLFVRAIPETLAEAGLPLIRRKEVVSG